MFSQALTYEIQFGGTTGPRNGRNVKESPPAQQYNANHMMNALAPQEIYRLSILEQI